MPVGMTGCIRFISAGEKMHRIVLLADRNSPANVWLREHPLVISVIAGLLGMTLLYFGIVGLKNGVTKDQFGNELTGGVAAVSSVVRLVVGVGAIGVAIYVSIYGAW